jgi:hypothetical protein
MWSIKWFLIKPNVSLEDEHGTLGEPSSLDGWKGSVTYQLWLKFKYGRIGS